MKLIIEGKWEIDLIADQISKELEEEVARATRLTNQIDEKVPNNGNTARSDGSARESKRDASED
jgi:hypothetical protein